MGCGAFWDAFTITPAYSKTWNDKRIEPNKPFRSHSLEGVKYSSAQTDPEHKHI